MSWVKALLLFSYVVLGCADFLTTNVILDHGLQEANPFMSMAQDMFGVWWLIPKLGLTLFVAWLLQWSNNVYNIALVVAFCSTPVLNNIVVISAIN